MSRPLARLWLDVLRAPSGFTFIRHELALVDPSPLGRVDKPDTLNYRTLEPAKGGLFCPDVFGPGDTFPAKRAPDVPLEGPRATTFGRIDLPEAFVHPLVAAHASDAVVEHGDAVRIRAVPVLPPHQRPMLQTAEKEWVTSDLNDLYRRAINRANRQARLTEINAPEAIIVNERQMLAEALISLFENEVVTRPTLDDEGRMLVSLRGAAGGNDALFAALADADRGAPLTRTTQRALAMLYAMGLELRPIEAQLGVPL